MIRTIAAIAVLFLSSSASAQSTTCQRIGDFIRCTQASGARPYNDSAIMQEGRDMVPDYADTEPRRTEPQAQSSADLRQRRALEAAVGKMVAEGDCKGAESTALKGGDFGLATRVRAYCASSPAPSE